MRLALVGAWILGLLAVYVGIRTYVVEPRVFGQDTHAYWLAAQGAPVYDKAPGQLDAYLYSPVFLTLVRPLGMLSWPWFHIVWVCLEAAVLLWLVKPLPKRWAVPVVLCCSLELLVGNIHMLLAAAAVLGMRTPAAWAFPVLTKITPGVGLLWFAVRGQWGRLLQGVGCTILVIAVSYAWEPGSWHAWVRFLAEHRSGTPDSSALFALRCLLAVALVVLGARKNWPWLIAPAMALTLPVVVAVVPLTVLVAVPRLMLPHDRASSYGRIRVRSTPAGEDEGRADGSAAP